MLLNNVNPSYRKKTGLTIAAVVVGGLVVSGCFFTVDEKERAVVLRTGELVDVADPGLHFKLPFLDSVKRISVQNHTSRYETVHAYSKDQQAAVLNISVSWHVEPGQVADLYRGYGDLETMVSRLVSRQVPTQAENVFGRYTAIRAVQDRAQLVSDLATAIRTEVKGPVVIESVNVEGIDFSDAYEKSIELRMRAEVEVTTRQQMLATEKVQAEIRVTQANAEAEAKIAQAKADAEATRLRGDAEAESIKARAAALASNVHLVELTKAERWDGKLPTTMLPNSAVPFISANPGSGADAGK